ncbi:RidA family protein [Variovorax sp. 2RAF20]
MLKVHVPADIFTPIAPYAQAVEVISPNRWLYISGTMGFAPDGSLENDFEAQAVRVWSNVQATLASAQMTFANLAKVTIWLPRREDWRLGAEIRQRFLGDLRVAMSVVEVGLVDPAWLIEVEAVAVA